MIVYSKDIEYLDELKCRNYFSSGEGGGRLNRWPPDCEAGIKTKCTPRILIIVCTPVKALANTTSVIKARWETLTECVRGGRTSSYLSPIITICREFITNSNFIRAAIWILGWYWVPRWTQNTHVWSSRPPRTHEDTGLNPTKRSKISTFQVHLVTHYYSNIQVAARIKLRLV